MAAESDDDDLEDYQEEDYKEEYVSEISEDTNKSSSYSRPSIPKLPIKGDTNI